MEPGNYLRIFLGRWRIIAFAGLIGAVAGFVTAPAESQQVRRTGTFMATHILIADTSLTRPAASQPRPEVESQSLRSTAVVATTGEVPARAAEKLGIDDPRLLTSAIAAEADTTVKTIRIYAVDPDRQRAADIANTVAAELQDFLQDERRVRYSADLEEAVALVNDLQRQLDEIQFAISQRPVDDPDPVLRFQREALTQRLQTAKDRLAALEASGEPGSGFATLQEARAAEAVRGGLPRPGTEGRRTTTTLRATAVDSTPLSGNSDDLGREYRVPIVGAMGLLLGAGLALLLERFDARVRTRQAAELAFGLPVVAEVPRQPRGQASIAVVEDPEGREAESYRLLRSRVLQSDASSLWIAEGATAGAGDVSSQGATAHAERLASSGRTETPSAWGRSRPDAHSGSPQPALRALLVTSPCAGDGKTTVTVNLAAAISEVGTSALVLDLDFRRSDMAKFFDGEVPVGLSDLLEHRPDVGLDDVVRSAVNSRFQVALSGRPLARPSEVLVAERELVATARTRADIVLLDTPPLLAVSETSELIPSSDAVVVVCRLNETTVDAAARSSEALARLRAQALGVVLISGSAQSSGSYFPFPKRRRRGRRTRHEKPVLVSRSGMPPAGTAEAPHGLSTSGPPLASAAKVEPNGPRPSTYPVPSGDGAEIEIAFAPDPSPEGTPRSSAAGSPG